MGKTVVLSTLIAADIKKAAAEFCKSHGIKLRYLIEQALREQLEDIVDREAYEARREEATIPFHKVLAGRKRK